MLRIAEGPPIWTLGCTGEFGCSCPQSQKAARLTKRGKVRVKAKHGSRSMYKRGCHCPFCTRANTKYQNDYNERKRNGTA